ncbi:hypothetical protein BHE74_00012065 [Ensete ventricosum]|nr:hypothetical protein BHE74_00012065 [Ensete ventricosum]
MEEQQMHRKRPDHLFMSSSVKRYLGGVNRVGRYGQRRLPTQQRNEQSLPRPLANAALIHINSIDRYKEVGSLPYRNTLILGRTFSLRTAFQPSQSLLCLETTHGGNRAARDRTKRHPKSSKAAPCGVEQEQSAHVAQSRLTDRLECQ